MWHDQGLTRANHGVIRLVRSTASAHREGGRGARRPRRPQACAPRRLRGRADAAHRSRAAACGSPRAWPQRLAVWRDRRGSLGAHDRCARPNRGGACGRPHTQASRPQDRRAAAPPHRSEIKNRHGLRVSSIPRLLIESAATGATHDDLHTLLEAAASKNLLNVEELAATLERKRGQRGVARVKRAAADYLPHPGRKSKLEQSFDRWLNRHPEIPEPQRNIFLGPWEIDCYWPQQRLALELDGREFHIAAQEFERDRLKDAWLQRNGNRVLRVTWRRWHHDRVGAESDLAALLALAQSQRPSQPQHD